MKNKGCLEVTLRAKNKYLKLFGYFDGDSTIEVYRDSSETRWIASLDMQTNKAVYYWSHFSSKKPDVANYSFALGARKWTNIELFLIN